MKPVSSFDSSEFAANRTIQAFETDPVWGAKAAIFARLRGVSVKSAGSHS
jgi:hypothetical protein